MNGKKYQVFVSSTFRDLSDERQDAIRNILDLKHIPAGMELFPATDVDQLEYIKRVIDECDYYVLIVGGRYGSVDQEGVSFTEREYEYAVETGKIVIAFVHRDPASIPIGKSETTQETIDSLNAFREKVTAGRLVKMWSDRQELELLVLKALNHAFNDLPQVGWIRGDAVASDDLVLQSNEVMRENSELRQELEKLRQAQRPEFDGLADFDEYFLVRYESGNYSSSYRKTIYQPQEVSLTWRSAFVGIGGCLEKSKTDYVFLEGLELIAENLKIAAPKRINKSDVIVMKAQFLALGLISSRVAKSTTGNLAEFLTLTDKGRRVLLENLVVRQK